jgi:hypothetical protein
MCEDYRAGASIDLKHDEADLHRKIACPLLVLWGARAPMGRIYDILSIWKSARSARRAGVCRPDTTFRKKRRTRCSRSCRRS